MSCYTLVIRELYAYSMEEFLVELKTDSPWYNAELLKEVKEAFDQGFTSVRLQLGPFNALIYPECDTKYILEQADKIVQAGNAHAEEALEKAKKALADMGLKFDYGYDYQEITDIKTGNVIWKG